MKIFLYLTNRVKALIEKIFQPDIISNFLYNFYKKDNNRFRLYDAGLIYNSDNLKLTNSFEFYKDLSFLQNIPKYILYGDFFKYPDSVEKYLNIYKEKNAPPNYKYFFYRISLLSLTFFYLLITKSFQIIRSYISH